MKPLKKRIARRAGYLAMLLVVLVLSGCGAIGRYNDRIASNVYATNTTYLYSPNGNLVGTSTSYK